MSEPDPVLVEVTRGGFVESLHRGRVVAVDADGEVTLAVGDIGAAVLLRSCAKPLQAVGMLRAGLDLDGAHLAIACGSHDGTDRHLALVDEILDGAGLTLSALGNAPLLALEPMAAARQLLAGGPDRIHHNCSGKHAAMLATCVANGWPTDGYLDREHPLQRAVRTAVEELIGEPSTHVAVDGCGAPISAVSLTGLARAFSRLAVAGQGLPEGRVAAAMRAHPEVVGGAERGVTQLMRALPGSIAKDGAEGAFAVALADGRALAVKVADGANRPVPPLVVAALRAIGVTDDRALDPLAEVPVLGHGRPVGSIRARSLR